MVEVDKSPGWQKTGRRQKKTERKLVNVVRDLTVLNDPIRSISQLVNDRGIYESEAMK